ncbi:MAG: hypothetical protein BV458_10260 [Thermoplasmata archaeon M9B2D]|nr:MAG: hypothetical protein BV458_10260 [Thermoplasmata archaeon M9B2D]
MPKRKALAIILILIGVVFLVDELWMFGLPIGHILPDLSEFHIAPFGFQYHHWMTGIILLIVSLALLYSDT